MNSTQPYADQPEPQPYAAPPDTPATKSGRGRTLLIIVLLALNGCTILAIPVAFLVGAINGNTQVYQNFARRQQIRIEDFFELHPGIYTKVEIHQASEGWVFLVGSVSTQKDYDRLSDELFDMFGDQFAEKMISGVTIEESP